MALGTFLGYAALVWAVTRENHSESVAGHLVIAAGETLQALLGAWLIDRFLARPLLLVQAREVLLFLVLGGRGAALIAPTVVVWSFVYLYNDFNHAAQMPGIWLDYWISSCGGIVVGAPRSDASPAGAAILIALNPAALIASSLAQNSHGMLACLTDLSDVAQLRRLVSRRAASSIP